MCPDNDFSLVDKKKLCAVKSTPISISYFRSGDIKQIICCSFSSPSTLSSPATLPSIQLGGVPEKISTITAIKYFCVRQTNRFTSKIFHKAPALTAQTECHELMLMTTTTKKT